MLSARQLLGLDDSHLVRVGPEQLEAQTAEAFGRMQQAAAEAEAGFQLALASGWRGFDRQLAIFNGKAKGQRPLQDRQGQQCDVSIMSDADILDAILAWSALPGTSRHHWGTDLDWFDAGAMEARDLQLEPWEYAQQGPCGALFLWMEANMARFGFFRPYRKALGGVSPEPWHISYAPIAVEALEHFDVLKLADCLANSELALKDTVTAQLPGLVERYCYRISAPGEE